MLLLRFIAAIFNRYLHLLAVMNAMDICSAHHCIPHTAIQSIALHWFAFIELHCTALHCTASLMLHNVHFVVLDMAIPHCTAPTAPLPCPALPCPALPCPAGVTHEVEVALEGPGGGATVKLTVSGGVREHGSGAEGVREVRE